MAIGTRMRERAFGVAMWAVSILFAFFRLGLGRAVIGDLPAVTRPVALEQFLNPDEVARIEAQLRELDAAEAAARERLRLADERLSAAAGDYAAEKAAFDNWIAARTATTDPAQDPEVLRRTRALDALKSAERDAERARAGVAGELDAVGRARAERALERSALEEAVRPRFERERFLQRLKVFGARLAFVLPVLLAAGWLLFQKTRAITGRLSGVSSSSPSSPSCSSWRLTSHRSGFMSITGSACW